MVFTGKVPLRDANGSIVKWMDEASILDERKAAEKNPRTKKRNFRKC